MGFLFSQMIKYMKTSVYIFLSIIVLFSIYFLFSCKCCDLPDDYQSMIDSVNEKYKNYLEVEHIPCEPNYINIKLSTNNIDTTMINEVHNLLYNSEKKQGGLPY